MFSRNYQRILLVLFYVAATPSIFAEETKTGRWRTHGFAEFRAGCFGNAGENIYVSQKGVLQRIRQNDFNGDGWFDLVLCNAQDFSERAPAYVYDDPLKNPARRTELPSDGSLAGTMHDLNGDGYDDLVLAMYDNGIQPNLNAIAYYGSTEGLSERRKLFLPAPECRSVAAGDFNGDGRADLAFMSDEGLRLFYQTELGYETKRFAVLAICGNQIAAEDLDDDGHADLVVRRIDGSMAVYWGGPAGLKVEECIEIQADEKRDSENREKKLLGDKYEEYVEPALPLPGVIRIGHLDHIFIAGDGAARLTPVMSNRTFGAPIVLSCQKAMSAAAGDINGDGLIDLAIACQEPCDGRQRSWIFWGNKEGLSDSRRSPLPSNLACDVAVGDLDGDGCDEVALCQTHTKESFTTNSLIYCGSKNGAVKPPIELKTESARRTFLAASSASKQPQVVFVNFNAGKVQGRPDVSIFLGGDDGYHAQRKISVSGAGAVRSIGADLDDNGMTDLVVINCSENAPHLDPGSYVFYNNREGLPHQPSLKLPTTRAHGAACADLNRDGYLDLIFCGFDNSELLIFFGTNAGFDIENPQKNQLVFGEKQYKEPRFIYLADLNNDGWLDLVVPMILDDRSAILWGGQDGFSKDRCQLLSVDRAACATAADLSGNGYLDLILGGFKPTTGIPHDSFVYIYWNGPDGLSQDRRTMLPGSGIIDMAVADFNNDDQLDLFVASYHAGTHRDCDSFIYWNQKDRGFSAMDFTQLFTHSAAGCVAADFNENGWMDLAIANHKIWGDHRGWSAIWWNGPDGFDPKKITRLPSEGPHGMTTASPGNQRDRGPDEYYQSTAVKLPTRAAVTKISWIAEIPPKTWVKAQLRSADSKAELDRVAWSGPDGPTSWFSNGQTIDGKSHAGKWMQYRLALGAVNAMATPRVTEVLVEYENP